MGGRERSIERYPEQRARERSFVPLGPGRPHSSTPTAVSALERRNATTGLGFRPAAFGRWCSRGASLVERKYSLRRCVRYLTLPGARMARRHGAGATLQSARKRVIIKEIQAAVARELAARSEVPKTLPQRIADLLRELHRRLRNPNEEAAPRLDPDRAHQPPKET